MQRAMRLVLLASSCLAIPLSAAARDTSQPRSSEDFEAVILDGLAPVTALQNTAGGGAALAGNYAVTHGIQSGALAQALLMPFTMQRQQALEDVFIGASNLAQLADGLGTTLAASYQARAHDIDHNHHTSISEGTEKTIAYAIGLTGDHGNLGKWFFANATTDNKTSARPELAAILGEINGKPDMFGTTYQHPAGSPDANQFGNSRPFQTLPATEPIFGLDYFSVPTDSQMQNLGPNMNLLNSPSYPSGHSTYGYSGAIVLAMMVPERYPEMMARAAEYGNNRIIMGAHYAMDVIAGRTLALYDLAHLLANEPSYMGHTYDKLPFYLKDAFGDRIDGIDDFRAAIEAARDDVREVLEAACGDTIAACAVQDKGRFRDSAADKAFYESTQTYDLPVVFPDMAGTVEDVAELAPEAGYLLTVAFPSLTLEEADRILTETQGPGGGFLDDGSEFGVYSRLDLYAAAERAAQVAGSATITR